MAPKKSKVKNRVAQPAKGIIERTHNRANDMCAPYVEARPEGGARTEKEIGEKV